jgi:hypothetical protein
MTPARATGVCPQGDVFRTTFPVTGGEQILQKPVKTDKWRIQSIVYDLAIETNYNSLEENLKEGAESERQLPCFEKV